MICPKCNEHIDFSGQMKEWEAIAGDDVTVHPEFPIYINLICDTCEEGVAGVFIEAVVAHDSVKTPDGDDVIINIHPGQENEIAKDTKNAMENKNDNNDSDAGAPNGAIKTS